MLKVARKEWKHASYLKTLVKVSMNSFIHFCCAMNLKHATKDKEQQALLLLSTVERRVTPGPYVGLNAAEAKCNR